ncbi:unnamed protein product [Rotaria magnacalcarata]|uniref:Uncharacterized protein n=2 Tax=Rotaria magnacalcarata TaxID=392030 RepID=A0A820QE38_9BILA|nr:unnamed protein product [Rotaria magnacalcarata]
MAQWFWRRSFAHLGRNQNDTTKLIQSKRVHLHSQQKPYNNNDHIQWPSLNQYPATKTTLMNQNLNDTIKSFSDELRELKKTYNEDQRRIKEKYKDHTNSIKQTLQIMQQQQQTQQQMITTITNSIKQIIFSTCTKTTSTVGDLLNKMKMQTKVNDFDENIQQLKNQTQCIKEAESLFFMHVNALDYLADKQNETLKEAVRNLFKDINV